MRLGVRGAVIAAVVVALVPAAAQAGELDQEYVATGGSCSLINSVFNGAQTFTAGKTGSLDRVDVQFQLLTNAVAPLTVEIRDQTLTGEPGPNVLGSGVVLAQPANINAVFYAVTLGAPVPVVSGGKYSVVAYTSDPEAWCWADTVPGTYPGGASANSIGGPPALGPWTLAPTLDKGFRTYVVPTGPTTLTVDDDKVQCPTAGFTTIHAALAAAGPGDTINVCRGTYSGEHVIEDDGVTIVSSTAPQAAVVNAPNSNAFYIESGVQDVSVLKFRINGGTGSAGLVAKEGASYKLIRENVISGFQNGVELLGGGVGKLVRDNHISGFTNEGISLRDQNTSVDARNNTIIGKAGTTGIFFGSSTTGLAFANSVSKNGSYGIRAEGAGQTIKANTVSAGGIGIWVNYGTGFVENNNVGSNSGDGIKVQAGGYTFASNNARGNTGLDCNDLTGGSGTGGTANTWIANYGYDWNVAGICTK